MDYLKSLWERSQTKLLALLTLIYSMTGPALELAGGLASDPGVTSALQPYASNHPGLGILLALVIYAAHAHKEGA